MLIIDCLHLPEISAKPLLCLALRQRSVFRIWLAQQSWEKLHFVTHTHKRSLTAHSRLPAESPPPPRPKWTHTGRLSSLQWRIIGPRHFGKYLNSTLFPQRWPSRPSPATSHSTPSDSPEMSCKNRYVTIRWRLTSLRLSPLIQSPLWASFYVRGWFTLR